MRWHYAKQGQQFGPIEEDVLCRLAQTGELAPDDLVWNPALGDKWVPAAAIENLFDFSSLPMPPPGGAIPHLSVAARGEEPVHNRDLMRMAHASLQSRWGFGAGVMLLYLLIIVGVSMIPYLGTIAQIVITGPMAAGLCFVFLSLARQAPVEVGQLFRGFNCFGTAVGAYLLMTLFVLLWSLLFLIPGIIASYAYAMTFFVIADDPGVGPLQAITRSKEMMRGRKWKLFCLFCRFLGWSFLCILTLGIGYLWLGPYMQTTLAHFYDDVKQR